MYVHVAKYAKHLYSWHDETGFIMYRLLSLIIGTILFTF